MNKLLRRGLIASAALAAVATPASVLAAGSASALPPPPPPPHVIHTTSIQTSATHLGPFFTIYRDAEYTPTPTAPGFANTSNIVEVCVAVPHVFPPAPLTVLADCNWRLTTTGPLPHSSLSGTAFLDGLGQVGRVTGGTGIWRGAHSFPLPVGFLSQNLAPRVAADTFTFFTP